jgi:glycosyltransferase involved in cell wall biosynthesis
VYQSNEGIGQLTASSLIVKWFPPGFWEYRRCAQSQEIHHVRILYTSNFHGNDGGGITTYIVNLARALAPRHTVVIAAPQSGRLHQTALTIPGVEVVPMEFRNSLRSMIDTGSALRQLMESRSFDIVHVNGSADHRIVMLASLGLANRPSIVYTKHHDLPTKGLMPWIKAAFATDSVICISDYMKQQLAATVYRNKGLQVVRHGVDLQWYFPFAAEAAKEARQHWLRDAPEDVIAIGSIAGTGIYKGWLEMVAAAASLPAELRSKIRILVAGCTPSDAEQQQVAALQMENNVLYTGLLQDVRPLVAALDVGFVLSRRETLSFACREMMAMGKPVIVSAVGGLPENVTPGRDGWIVPSQDKAELTALLQKIVTDRQHLAAFGQAARLRSEREFSLHSFAADTESVYHECVNRVHQQRTVYAAGEGQLQLMTQPTQVDMAIAAGERHS